MGISALCSAAPFTNGSFESPGGASILFLGPGSTQVTGWLHGGNNVNSGEFYTQVADFGVAAQNGTYYIGWGGNAVTGGTLAQTFDTVAGSLYNVNYFLLSQQCNLCTGLPVQANLVEALNGIVLLNSATNNINFQTQGVWNAGATLTFQATSTSTTLRFTDATLLANSPSINWGLDNVTLSITREGSGVPEPATYGLVGTAPSLPGLAPSKVSLA